MRIMNRLLSTVLTILLCHYGMYAQTPLEKKKQREAEEQKKIDAEKIEKNKNVLETANAVDKDLFSKQMNIPKEFSNESVVMLAQSFSYEFKTKKGVPVFTERYKKRIFLKDKAAVESNSTFYTQSDGAENPIEVKIIKPNGKVEALQLKDGIKETNSATIPLYYKSAFTVNESYYKYAIPNLEPGDVIEYTVIYDSKYVTVPFMQWYMNTSIPILNTKINIQIGKKYYAYYKSLNNAPQFKQKQLEDGTLELTLIDSMRAKIGNDWLLPYEPNVPNVKVLLSYLDEFDFRNCVFPINPKKEARVQTKIKEDQLYHIGTIMTPPKATIKYTEQNVLEKFPKSKKNIDEYVEKIWHKLRYYSITSNNILEGYYHSQGFFYYSFTKGEIMISTICEILKRNKQKFDLIITTPNNECSVDDVLTIKEVKYIIKWKDKYICPAYYNVEYGQLAREYWGSQAYLVKDFDQKKVLSNKAMPFTRINLPTTHMESSIKEFITVKLEGDENSLVNASRKIVVKGANKAEYLEDYFNREFLYDLQKDALIYEAVDSSELYKRKAATVEERKRKDKEAQIQYFSKLRENYEGLLKSDYANLDKYISWKIPSTGIVSSASNFELEEKFTISNIVAPIGNGYAVQLGYMLGKYNRFKDEDLTRNYPGKVKTDNVVEFNIEFTIPEGFKVSSLGDFVKSFDSPIMSFNSTIKTEGDKVILNVKRVYKKIHFSVEEYQFIVKYYEIMDNLTQTKLIIKPL